MGERITHNFDRNTADLALVENIIIHMSRSTAEYSQQLLDLMGAESSQYAKAPSYETSAYAKAPSYENSAYAKTPSYENSAYAKAPSYDVNRTYTDDLQVIF